MNKIARPAQTGQCRSRAPSSRNSTDSRDGKLFPFAQFCGRPTDKLNIAAKSLCVGGVQYVYETKETHKQP
jgi:hypothetical protein